MNRTTIITALIALASLAGAVAMRPQPVPQVAYEDTGQLMFANFTDPQQAASLEVTGWDEGSARVTNFKVELKDGKWVIPSHNDYPADGTERMGKAAASFIDVRKDIYRGDRPEDHAKFGLDDPSDPNAKERGQRFTIKDASGTVLVDVIVGKKVEDKEGYRYVRTPDSKRVYAAKIDVDISTAFTDWIEKDLLKLEQDQIVQFMSDTYKVDESTGKVVGSDPFLVKKDAAGGEGDDWLIDPQIAAPEGKELDAFKVRQALSGLDRLQIVGVRPRPEMLTLQALQAKGFFVTRDGSRLYGNEGEVKAILDDGVVYNLYFGEVTYDSGLALTAGAEQPPEAKKEGEEAKDEKKEANRYMFVDVFYDPMLDTKSPPAEGKAPDDAPGAKRAKQLSERFGKWFYVISDASFKQIRKDKAEFFKDKPAGSATTPATPPAPAKKDDKKGAKKDEKKDEKKAP